MIKKSKYLYKNGRYGVSVTLSLDVAVTPRNEYSYYLIDFDILLKYIYLNSSKL